METNDERIAELSRALVDKGLLIEAGWTALRMNAIPPGASDTQVREMRKAFFCGAQHLFASVLSMLDPGEDETEPDMRRMGAIAAELDLFMKTL